MNQLKKLRDCISPLSWLFTFIAVVTPLTVILRPTWVEFSLMMLVDAIALGINAQIESRVFKWLYPDTVVYFDGIEDSEISKMSKAERLALVESFVKYPKRRAVFFYFGSFIKVLPAFFMMTFHWKHSISNLAQFLICFAISSVNFCYVYGAVFIEAHMFLSKKLEELHEKFDFSEVFESTQLTYSKGEFEYQEILIIVFIVFIVFFMVGLQLTIVLSQAEKSLSTMAFQLILVAFIGVILLVRIWYLGRKMFIGGLEKLFHQMNTSDYQNLPNCLSLNTSPLLARFEKSYNLLNQRLKLSEQELSSLVIQESDKSRYRVLGEISALIAHDLSGPLHAADFCVKEIIENPQTPRLPVYITRISTNLERALELIGSLRARLKNPTLNPDSSSFAESHKHVIKLLELQFRTSLFKKIRFILDGELEALKIRIPPSDLIHILNNLYRNSAKNLIESDIKEPFIKVHVSEKNNELVTLHIQDNGTGLSLERFQQMTAFQFARSKQGLPREGLGLRLTKRLIELNGGGLTVIDFSNFSGTTFCLQLKVDFVPV